jgi:hypothetical protein
MANKLQLAHERRKIALKGAILSGRAQVASLQERIKRHREELKSMQPKKGSGAGPGGPPTVRLR